MANSIFRSRMSTKIADAVRDAKDAASLKHHGVKGRMREIVIQRLIEPLLLNGVEVATGIVVDSYGNQSTQMDVIVYSSSILPSFMREKEQAFVPVESCLQVIEVKSRLTSKEIRDCIKKAESIKRLGIRASAVNPLASLSISNDPRFKPKFPPIFSIFAFDSDLSSKGKGETDRYKKNVPDNLQNNVLVNDICVVGKGYWRIDSTSPTSWAMEKPTQEFDEVIAMLVELANSIPIWIDSRGTPSFGFYMDKNQNE